MWANSLNASEIQFVLVNLLSDDPENWVGYRKEDKDAVLKVGRYYNTDLRDYRWDLEVKLGKHYPGLIVHDSANRWMHGFDILDRQAKDRLLKELLAELMGVNQMSRGSKNRLSGILNALLR